MVGELIIHMRNIPGTDDARALDRPLPCLMPDGTTDMIPSDFSWDGNSTPFLVRPIFPRHNHPIASCRHDYRCGKAKNKAERKFADVEYERDVGTTSWWITKKVGYIGVRIGALFGIGSNF